MNEPLLHVLRMAEETSSSLSLPIVAIAAGILSQVDATIELTYRICGEHLQVDSPRSVLGCVGLARARSNGNPETIRLTLSAA